MPLQLSIAEASAQGPRPDNQDALRSITPAAALLASKGVLCAIADGVSQCADGRLAAQSTLHALAQDYYATPQTWATPQALERLLSAQNRWLRGHGNGQSLLTTLSALILRGRRYTLAHIGDCRVYLWQDGQLQQLTEDHVWDQNGMQHVLRRALGLDQHLLVDYREGPLAEGDVFLLLTDGIWASLGDRGIRSILQSTDSPEQWAPALVRAAHLSGSQDNASALLVRVDALPAASLADSLGELPQWPVPRRLRSGQTFEGWHVAALLRESQQSLLYRVSDAQQRPWLLKTLPAALAEDGAAGARLLQEEWFLRRVAGRHFPEVHGHSQRQHLYYVQREYPGQTLAQRLDEQGPLALAEWLSVARRLLRALGLLHRRNIVHGDIKPENLHEDSEGELRILDFGLAYCPGLSEPDSAGPAGTPNYLPPEAYAGQPPSPQQDLFAAGVTLFRLLCGRGPYPELEPFQRPRFGEPSRPSRYRADAPPWLDTFLTRLIASAPTERYETAEECLLALEVAERQGLEQRPIPLLQRAPERFWRGLALLSLLCNLWLIARLWH